MDDVAPEVTVRISSKRKIHKPWLALGLERSNHKCQKLYKKTLTSGCTEGDLQKYKSYRNILNRAKYTAMHNYYNSKCVEYKDNTRKLWQLINNHVGKCKQCGSIIPYIMVNGLKTYNPDKITNSFRQFYADLGGSLASNIIPGNKTIEECIRNMPRTLNSLVMWPTSGKELEELINDMPKKPSSGHDQVSNKLLKDLSNSITFPLTTIFNQSLESGVFPDLIKMAEMIPLYKGKEQDIIVNYHPISLLMTLSKLLEKVVYIRVYNFPEHNQILYESQFGF